MADLNQFNALTEGAGKTAWLHLENPATFEPLYADGPDGEDDKTKPMRIELVGKDSKPYRRKRHSLSNSRLKKAGRAGGLNGQTSEGLENDATSLLVACTRDFENISSGGEVLEFNEFNVRRLYEDHSWIREQVDTFVAERGNFLGESSGS